VEAGEAISRTDRGIRRTERDRASRPGRI